LNALTVPAIYTAKSPAAVVGRALPVTNRVAPVNGETAHQTGFRASDAGLAVALWEMFDCHRQIADAATCRSRRRPRLR
jgi:hypothetical protein